MSISVKLGGPVAPFALCLARTPMVGSQLAGLTSTQRGIEVHQTL